MWFSYGRGVFFGDVHVSKLNSQKGSSGEGSLEAFWGRKTVPKQVFEGSIMVLEKDANLKGVRDIPANAEKRRQTASNGCPGPKGILSRETLRGFPWENSLQGEFQDGMGISR